MPAKNILVVEDENIVAIDIRRRLEKLGYTVHTGARTAKAALELTAQHHPDLVLMDVMLDGNVDGIDAATEIREQFQIPIVFLTAFSDDEHLERAKKAHPLGYLLKPVADRDLRATIEVALSKHAMELASQQWVETTLESIGDAVITTTNTGYLTFMNPVAERLTGWRHEQALGKDVSAVLRLLETTTASSTTASSAEARADDSANGAEPVVVEPAPGAEPTVHDPVKQLRHDEQEQQSIEGEAVLVTKTGEQVPVSYNVARIRDEAGRMVGAVLVCRDVTEAKEVEQQLIELAHRDPLTGLYNRRHFLEELEFQLAQTRRHGTPGAILWFDLDEFKEVNDRLGHHAGDELLAQIVSWLRTVVRETDVFARLGGDEFGILMPHTDRAQALASARRILDAIRRGAYIVGQQPVRVSASIGIALFPTHGVDGQELLSRADVAMYRAKAEGRDGYRIFEPERDAAAELSSTFALTETIRQAVANDKLVLFAQPIVHLTEPGLAQYELLSRITADDGDLILPSAFVKVAERSGLIQNVDTWVVRQAIELLAGPGGPESPDWCVEVNLSARSITNLDIAGVIREELAAHRVRPERLVIEITETAAVADIAKADEFIRSLKQIGCRFAIDDFGVGFSSFYYLKHLEVDYLKLDGSFIQQLSSDPSDQCIVRGMIDVAHGLGKQTIAEYVEDEATLQLLRDYGADFAQGFHVGRPQPVEELFARAGTTKLRA